MNLEENISAWRKQMLAAGIKTPVPLEELENHLREDIAQHIQAGWSAQQAFEIAVKKIGPASELKNEFKKIGTPMKIQQIIKLAGAICVTVALFCPLFMFLPFLLAHELNLMTKMLGLAVYATIIATIVLSWRYNHKLLPAIHNQLPRRAVGLVCYVGCLLWIRFVLFHLPAGVLHSQSIFLVLFIFGLECTVIAILGGVSHGLEKAASKTSATIDLSTSQS